MHIHKLFNKAAFSDKKKTSVVLGFASKSLEYKAEKYRQKAGNTSPVNSAINSLI